MIYPFPPGREPNSADSGLSLIALAILIIGLAVLFVLGYVEGFH